MTLLVNDEAKSDPLKAAGFAEMTTLGFISEKWVEN